ncbi:hypothetical protein Q8A73_017381 [Channa argus]|nr:hypothetical protein Q8A73_017381 [Channa argus]
MWPDKPLAPESALVGRTQLAPDRPPQPPRHSQNPLAAATVTSLPGATATSYRSNTQPGTRFWESGDHAENLHSPSYSGRESGGSGPEGKGGASLLTDMPDTQEKLTEIYDVQIYGGKQKGS